MAKAARMTSSAFGFCPECSLGWAVLCQKSMREQGDSLAAGLQAAIRVSLLAEAGAAGRGFFWPMSVQHTHHCCAYQRRIMGGRQEEEY
ncbi:hypothetical protein EK904_004567 [Melospiza melodia maxima]|nr:hypothetical protein EK904_004567 [Melospiza melodia maxima]